MRLKKIIKAVMVAILLTLGMAGSAFAEFTDLHLIRVVYSRTATTSTVEAATDLGLLSSILATGGTTVYGGGASAFTAATGDLAAGNPFFVAYFASDRTNGSARQLWLSGSSSTAAPTVGSTKAITTNSELTNIYAGYAPLTPTAGTVTQAVGNSLSYSAQSGRNGSFGNVITTNPNVDASLANLASGPVTQYLYYKTNYGTSGAMTKVPGLDGATAISLVTNADGSTTIINLAGTPVPQVTAFSVPASSDSLTVPVTTLTVSNPSAVAGYLITESATPPAPADPLWSSNPPTAYTLTAPGSYTLFLWLKNSANSVSTLFTGAPVTVNGRTLNITFDPTGNGVGRVFSSPPGIDCSTGSAGGCTATYLTGATLTLTAANNWKNLFSGWSGTACTGVDPVCDVTMDADKTATAGFTANVQARLVGQPPADYASLQDAYEAAHNAVLGAAAIQSRVYTFLESMALTHPIALILDGGKDAGYQNNAGYSTVQGMTIAQGSAVVSNLIIH